MRPIPQEDSLDSTLALLSYGYQFISKKCEHLGTDIFSTRIALQEVICMQGAEAAALFYDEEKFTRKNATPKFVQKTLFGLGGVQGLDRGHHQHRKQLFMGLMSPENINRLVKEVSDQLEQSLDRWVHMEQLPLFDAMNELLFRAVCRWGGVPFNEEEVNKKTRDVVSMIEGPAAVGWRHWRGRMGRELMEYWIQQKVKTVRDHQLITNPGTFMHEISWHRDSDGELLDKRVAAVEILNMIRPTVAIGRYIVFAAMALHDHPEYRARIQREGDELVSHFVQEVRRFYPFFPFVAAKVRHNFQWKGYAFDKGTTVFLDLYGTNHHKEIYKEPYQFIPERFAEREPSPFDLIPQGGGDHHRNHRCAGEWLTIELMKIGLKFLATTISYHVPKQDLSLELNRFPALPKSRFVIQDIQRYEVR